MGNTKKIYPRWIDRCTKRSKPGVVAAIDPGVKGAMAILKPDACIVFDMPLKRHGKRDVVDYHALQSTIDLAGVTLAVLEDVHPTPKMSASSGFRMGHAFCTAEAAFFASNLLVVYVPAQRWKRELGLIGKGKDGSLDLAREQFPEMAEYLARKKDDGRAEALLLAKYFEDYTWTT